MAKTWYTVIILWVLQAILLSAFVADAYILRVMDNERAQVVSTLGTQLGGAVVDRGDRWFNAMFVETGVRDRTYEMWIPTDQQRENSKGMEHAGEKMFGWMERRLTVFWLVIRQMLLRISSAMVWLPYALLIIVPAVVDGYVVRAIKRANVSYSSPALRMASVYLVLGLLWLFVFLLFVPAPLNPLVTPAFLALVAVSSWLFAANLQKRI